MTPRKPRRRVSPHAKLLKQARPHYEWLLNVQGGVCAICGNPPKPGGKRLNIDHSHSGLYVRGLLCHRCNRVLWAGGDRVEWMRKAIRYLEQPPVQLPDQPT